MQNKANFKIGKINISSTFTKGYEEKPPLAAGAKQTQTKPISKGTHRHRLTWLSLVLALAVLLQAGCQPRPLEGLGQEQAKAPDESEAALVAAEPAITQQEAQPAPQAVKAAPKIKFEKLVHDFGEVAARTKYAGEFTFTNTGDGLLKITEVKKCCGVVTRLSKEEFAPGESGTLKVDYNSSAAASSMTRKLYVSSNDKTNPKVELTIKAKVVPKVAHQPQRLDLSLDKENGGCPNITVTSLDNQPFSIRTFQSTGGSITADVDSSVEATKFVLQPKVDLKKLQIRPTGFVSIDLIHPEHNRVYLAFKTLLKFEFKPRSIIVFNPEPQKPIVRKVFVVSNYNEDFEIEATSSRSGLAKVLSQEKVANGYQLEVEITPPPDDDTGKFDDVLYVSLKGGEKLAIKCYVRYLEK